MTRAACRYGLWAREAEPVRRRCSIRWEPLVHNHATAHGRLSENLLMKGLRHETWCDLQDVALPVLGRGLAVVASIHCLERITGQEGARRVVVHDEKPAKNAGFLGEDCEADILRLD